MSAAVERRQEGDDRRQSHNDRRKSTQDRRLFGFDRRHSLPGLTAIGFDDSGVSVVRVLREAAGLPRIMDLGYLPLINSLSPAQAALSLAQEHQLNRTRCTTLLHGFDYKLLMTEAPSVPDEELVAALRWKIKDLLDAPVKDMALDVFDVPATGGASRMVYVVAAHHESIKKRVDLLTSAAINLQIIDIPELAQRNIAALLPEDQQGVAVLWLKDKGGLLTLTRQGELYLCRNLSVGVDDVQQQGTAVLDQIVLEVQRSLDYFESHFRQAPIRHLMLAPMPEPEAMIDYLQRNLSVSVAHMNLTPYVQTDLALPDQWQIQHYLTLGAALRREDGRA